MSTACTPVSLPLESPVRGAGHRWKVLGVGVAANASFSAAAAGLPTTAIWLRSGYQLSNAELGIALGAMGLGVALSELPWGMATDRWGDRPVLLWGLLGTMLSLLSLLLWITPVHGAVPSLFSLAAGLALVGVLGGSVNGSSGRAVMRWFGPGERGFAMSIRQTAVPLGGALGALILPTLAARYGFAMVFGALAFACALSAAFAWRWMHEPDFSVEAAKAPQNVSAGLLSAQEAPPLRNGRIWRMVGAIALLCAPQSAILSYATIFLHDQGKLGLAAVTTVMVSLQAGAMVMRIWSGRHTDRHANRPAYLRGCVLVATMAFLLLGIVASINAPGWMLMVAIVLAGIAVSSWHGVGYTELATVAGSNHAGTALGMANTAVYVSFFLTPVLIPHLLDLVAWRGVWCVSAVVALAAWPLFPKR
ncbi:MULTISPECIES: MFS transporter [unclassified Janthinobacterium]|uniref:MFS transporter n=1 Tax=unclassified Janthinobacterium TaxID=2610881 RepID=UPI001612608D|nr:MULTISPECIES: MFS transporter [unclassified Janthinobacterium]MBB5371436.1 MFS family permease [Janthinobacterium sp. K2C7]MBB5384242.1 MFS family permease [Janthinobacterium sp. K2Li3]MBB5389517.1 MFS family permease [Janthinobacterium sp. K2E3]